MTTKRNSMSKSSQTTSRHKTANKQTKTANKQAKTTNKQAKTKATINKQSTPKPDTSLSWISLPAQQLKILEKFKDCIKQQYPDIPSEKIVELMQDIQIEDMSEELVSAIITNLQNRTINTFSFNELYASYLDDNDLVQDYQTLIEEQFAQAQKNFYYNLNSLNKKFSDMYLFKLKGTANEIVYINVLLDYISHFIRDISKHQFNLTESKLYSNLFSNIATICCHKNDDKGVSLPKLERAEKFADYAIGAFFIILQQTIESVKNGASTTTYQCFTQEIKDSLKTFSMPRAKKVIKINEKLAKENEDEDDLYFSTLLYVKFSQNNKDPSDIVSHPFESFLSDKNFSFVPPMEDLGLLLPTILKIQLKYFPQAIHNTCNDLFVFSCNWYGMDTNTFIAKMDEIRNQRINKVSKKQAKRVTFTVQNPQAISKDPSEQEKASQKDKNISSHFTKSTMSSKATQNTKNSDDTANKSEQTSLLSKDERHELFKALQAYYSQSQSELKYRNTFELLIGTIFLRKCDINTVNTVTKKFFAQIHNPEELAALDIKELMHYLKQVHMWVTSGAKLIQTAKILHEKYHDQVPNTYEELTKLPSVDPQIARKILSITAGQPFIPVSNHIIRFCNRTGLCIRKTPNQVEKHLLNLVDTEFIQHAHDYMNEHGRTICTEKDFENICSLCVAAPWCKYHKEHK